MSEDVTLEATLNDCLDALVAGADWRSGVPAGMSLEDVLPFMTVALGLLELGRRTRPRTPDAKLRIWRRISTFIAGKRYGPAEPGYPFTALPLARLN